MTRGGMPGQNQALTLINQILTTPRSGGVAPGNQPMGGLQIGGGIAGVASTVERTGIKIYNEKEKYNEWEFLYDLTKDKTGMGAAAMGAGIQQQQGLQPGQQPVHGRVRHPASAAGQQDGLRRRRLADEPRDANQVGSGLQPVQQGQPGSLQSPFGQPVLGGPPGMNNPFPGAPQQAPRPR